jgi:vacuolar-type H+-ATPase subunit I/STV1
MIFLNFIFGYLCILIVAKWASGSIADLYHVMITMFLAPGSMDAQGQVFEGQGSVQVRESACASANRLHVHTSNHFWQHCQRLQRFL